MAVLTDTASIGTKPSLIFPRLDAGESAELVNEGPTWVRVGTKDVTITSGLLLPAGERITVAGDEAWHGITPSDARCTISWRRVTL